MGPKIGLPYVLNQFQILMEGLMVRIPQVPHQRIFLSLPLLGWLPGMICFYFLLWRLVLFSPRRGHCSCGSAAVMGREQDSLTLQSRVRSPSEYLGEIDFLLTDGEDTSILLVSCWGRLDGPLHRPKEKTGEHASPPQGPTPPDFAWLPDAVLQFEGHVSLVALAFLIPVAWMTSALLVVAKQTASAFLMMVP